jgi:uncharacterized protein
MKIVSCFPRSVRDIENVFIPLSGGVRIAARIWLPEDAEASPVPAILEYIPYRKGDRMRERDEPMHAYFAGHGYATVRADVRGTGDSEGVLLDEYHAQEIEDALEILEWIAGMPWCTGRVGMMGKSWGGFNALQVAARRPPSLGAILTVCSSDDRYRDDAHYMGGCLLNENLVWGSSLFTLSALPPDPHVWGERWRDLWAARMEATTLFPETWLAHPHRDEYWKHGSVCEDYEAITCPVYAVGGWADAYTNAIPRLLKGLTAPRKGLIGPWAHVYPHNGVPGPAIGFLQEALRWWDHWLRDRDTGILDEPMLRAWMNEPVAPERHAVDAPGRWIAERTWPPSEGFRVLRYYLAPGRLALDAGSEAEDVGFATPVASPVDVGLDAGSWCSFGAPSEMPSDQAMDDAKSVVFDSAPLDERVEILGAPRVRLRLAPAGPFAMAAARLEDVFPDGTVSRVTYALLDLTHREGHDAPAPLVPGGLLDVDLLLNDCAYAFLPGHRVRLALTSYYWPVAWPPPGPSSFALRTVASALELPVRAPRVEDSALTAFPPPESAPNASIVELHRGSSTRTVTRDDATGETRYRFAADITDDGDPALTRVESTGMEHGHASIETYSITAGDPLSARAEILHDARFQREDWSVRVRTMTRLSCDERAFLIEGELEGFEDGRSVFRREYRSAVPRSGQFEP